MPYLQRVIGHLVMYYVYGSVWPIPNYRVYRLYDKIITELHINCRPEDAVILMCNYVI